MRSPRPFRRPALRPSRHITAAAGAADNHAQGGFLDATGASCAVSSHDGCRRHLVGPQFGPAITEPLHDRAQRP
ncbi:hypothetical protein [Streptomyces sp. NPDC059398]|uniref:hypothetical protein n=1 Tax=Streptomyces sp. NPDC059398 TaxID=3346820 RepID=UPI0036ACA695